MGLFSRRAKATDVDELRRQLVSLSARLDGADSDNAELKAQLEAERELRAELDERAAELQAKLDSPPLPAPTQKTSLADQAVVDELRLRIGKLQTRIDDMDARVTSATTELANQITEISDDLERSASDSDSTGADSGSSDDSSGATLAALEQLRDSQTRLANEQARYQIAFREDLAALAERIKR